MRRAIILVGICLTLVATTYGAYPERFKLTASDAASGDEFGRPVAISGNTAVVGARYNDDPGADPGSAYVFDADTGAELFKLTASDASAEAYFGGSVGIDGSNAIVGAWGANSAYLFDATTGLERFKLSPAGLGPGSRFGWSAAIEGNIAIVGAYMDNGAAGSAYVFDVTTGQQLRELTPSDAMSEDRFGVSVAISGNIAIVGAYGDDDPAIGASTGSAYLFDVTTGQELFKLTASDAARGDILGVNVAISGNTAIAGAYWHHGAANGSGAAYVFDVVTGQQTFKLTPSDAAEMDYFGLSVGLSGDLAIIGAHGDDDTADGSGSAYLFNVLMGTEIGKLTASDAEADDAFGHSVAISGDIVLIAARYNDDDGLDSGSAYLYDVPEPAALSLLSLGAVGLLKRRKSKMPS